MIVVMKQGASRAQVVNVTARIEQLGCRAHISKGDVLVGALGSRAALQGFVGRVPNSVRAGDKIHVLNLGGVLGECVSHNEDVGKPLEVEVVIPIEDMSTIGQVKVELTPGPATAALTERRTSIWPSIYPEILDRILANRSTIVFCNARRAAERLRHKDRASTLWDYERLVLEAAPELFRVKCRSCPQYRYSSWEGPGRSSKKAY